MNLIKLYGRLSYKIGQIDTEMRLTDKASVTELTKTLKLLEKVAYKLELITQDEIVFYDINDRIQNSCSSDWHYYRMCSRCDHKWHSTHGRYEGGYHFIQCQDCR